ncbi:putative cell wall glycosyl hydrolase Dfg5 [Tricladium varicosporioides]|nr:putative cell wall glycosyl hydrolase Dfg5 [Hymenoscyphus varicosporioides]
MIHVKNLFAIAAVFSVPALGFDLDVNEVASVKAISSSLASGLVKLYNGNQTGQIPGILPAPYFWWESGAMFDSLIQYWHLTGDSQYNSIISQALQFQQGPDSNYMPLNQSRTEGNDDQSSWALAAMSAAEANFPAPEGKTWVSLADAVFNNQVLRWDDKTCKGGLRWQIFTFNTGYTYKNSVSNGYFFQLASRLARYTGNSTYSDWASKSYDWTVSTGLIDAKYNAFDGADVAQECTSINKIQWSYVAGTFITGAAHMYNITSGDAQKKWKTALDGLLNQTLSVFFPSGVAIERSCELIGSCNTDAKVMKGLLGHFLIDTIQMAPYTSSLITPKITSTALAAAKACDSTGCPLSWNGTAASTKGGVGEQLSALTYVQGLLLNQAASPATGSTATGNGTATTTGSGSATNPSGTSSGTATPSSTHNAAVGMTSQTGTGMLMGFVGAFAFLVL